ncbi:MAG: GNAT family N-acetyltransferase [Parachlamydiaceae bacterium]
MKTQILTPRLILRAPQMEDAVVLKEFEKRNQAHLAQWESPREMDVDYHLSLTAWKKECDEGRSARFFLFPKDHPSSLIGMCNFTQIFRGAFQACYLGYKIDQEYEGQGLMFEALESLISYIFKELHLHRIMSNYMPVNARSAKLLQRLGFDIEGYAKDYLRINNRWEDHVLTALSCEKWLRKQTSNSVNIFK